MWWEYKKLEDTEYFCRYAYARESHELDGIIYYDKVKDEVTIEKRCSSDTCEFADKAARVHFYAVIRERFPDSRFVACG